MRQLTRLSSSLRPTLRFLKPTQTTCNYATIFLRNVASLLSEGDANGNYQRFLIVSAPTDPLTFELGPEQRGRALRAPANGPGRHNHLHVNPYPNTAAPAETQECEGGNEHYTAGQTLIGNTAGNQGLDHGREAMSAGTAAASPRSRSA